MNVSVTLSSPRSRTNGFSLVEMLVVIAIISILMTAGAIGISNLGGRGVTSGVDTAEALAAEARNMAIGKNLRTALLVAKALTNNPGEDRRRILVAHEETGADGSAADPNNTSPNWVLTSRGGLLPDQTFFSEVYSKANQTEGTGDIPEILHSRIVDVKTAYQGSYYIYEFNTQGMPKNAGAGFVIGTGSRMTTKPATTNPPKVTGSARRDFGGFVIWRNGNTSVFRSPDQISGNMKDIKTGTAF